MTQSSYTDEQLLDMIRGAEPERKAALRYIYLDGCEAAKRNILKKGGYVFDADDAVTEAIIILDHHVRKGKYVRKAALKSYFVAISYWQWLSMKRPTQKVTFTAENYAFEGENFQTPEALMLEKEQKELLRKLLESKDFGDRCREVVRLYGLKHTASQIAEIMKTTEGYARQMVFRCKNKLREILEQNPSFMKQLLDTI